MSTLKNYPDIILGGITSERKKPKNLGESNNLTFKYKKVPLKLPQLLLVIQDRFYFLRDLYFYVYTLILLCASMHTNWLRDIIQEVYTQLNSSSCSDEQIQKMLMHKHNTIAFMYQERHNNHNKILNV